MLARPPSMTDPDPDHADPAQALLAALDPEEHAAVLALLSDELARGWVPRRADVEAALDAVRRGRGRAR